jgi:hypothetical protein
VDVRGRQRRCERQERTNDDERRRLRQGATKHERKYRVNWRDRQGVTGQQSVSDRSLPRVFRLSLKA